MARQQNHIQQFHSGLFFFFIPLVHYAGKSTLWTDLKMGEKTQKYTKIIALIYSHKFHTHSVYQEMFMYKSVICSVE